MILQNGSNQFYLTGLIMSIINIGLFLLFIVFVFKGHQRRRKAPYISLAILFVLIGNVLASLPLRSNISFFLGILLVSISFLFIFLHYEMISREKANIIVCGFLIGLNITIFSLIIIYLIYNLNSYSIYYTIRFLCSLCGITAMIRSIIIIYRVNHLAKINATKLELFFGGFIFTYRFVFLIRDVFGIFEVLLTYIGLISSIIGILILLLNYIIHPDYIYLLPFPIHSFMLYNESGLLIYNKRVHIEAFKENFQGILITGVFTAISALIQESLGTGAKLKQINAEQYQIYFINLPRKKGTLAIISLGSTHFFKKSLNRFAQAIPDALLEKMNIIGINLKKIEPEIDLILNNSFSYANLSN